MRILNTHSFRHSWHLYPHLRNLSFISEHGFIILLMRVHFYGGSRWRFCNWYRHVSRRYLILLLSVFSVVDHSWPLARRHTAKLKNWNRYILTPWPVIFLAIRKDRQTFWWRSQYFAMSLFSVVLASSRVSKRGFFVVGETSCCPSHSWIAFRCKTVWNKSEVLPYKATRIHHINKYIYAITAQLGQQLILPMQPNRNEMRGSVS